MNSKYFLGKQNGLWSKEFESKSTWMKFENEVSLYILISIQDTEGVYEWKIPSNGLEFIMGNKSIFVMIIILEHSLKKKSYTIFNLWLWNRSWCQWPSNRWMEAYLWLTYIYVLKKTKQIKLWHLIWTGYSYTCR